MPGSPLSGANRRHRAASCPPALNSFPLSEKTRYEHRRQIGELYRRSHFFIMPSRAGAFRASLCRGQHLRCSLPRHQGRQPPVRRNRRCQWPAVSIRRRRRRAIQITSSSACRAPPDIASLHCGPAEDAAKRLSWKVSGRKVAEMLDELVRHGTSPAATEPKQSRRQNPEPWFTFLDFSVRFAARQPGGESTPR